MAAAVGRERTRPVAHGEGVRKERARSLQQVVIRMLEDAQRSAAAEQEDDPATPALSVDSPATSNGLRG